MQDKKMARGSATRTANMHKRRSYILECASKLIADNGFESFTLGKLATEAKVTIPTIHNLLGKKSQIVEQLVKQMVDRTEHVLTEPSFDHPVNAIEAFVERLIELFSSNEALYKAAFISGERQKLFAHAMSDQIFYRSMELAKQLIKQSTEQGLLLGEVQPNRLAQQIFASHRTARHDWMHGYTDLEGYRVQVLTGMFFTLATDASPSLRSELVEKINAL